LAALNVSLAIHWQQYLSRLKPAWKDRRSPHSFSIFAQSRNPTNPDARQLSTPQKIRQSGFSRHHWSLSTELSRRSQTEYNNALAELKDWQNAKVEYATGEAEKLAALQVKAAALAMLMNAIAQEKTGKLDKSIDLQKLTQEGEAFFSLYDSKIIEQRYPMP
jgi:predicted KAP-like P-loop ATPase